MKTEKMMAAELSRRDELMRNGLQEVSYQHRLMQRSNDTLDLCQGKPRFRSRQRPPKKFRPKTPKQPEPKEDYSENDITIEGAEWPDTSKPKAPGPCAEKDDHGRDRSRDRDRDHDHDRGGDHNRGGDHDRAGGPFPRVRDVCDPYMLPYTTDYFPAGPHGPRVQLCPYVPLQPYWPEPRHRRDWE
ncbi:uncharacterized protein DDB_G0284459-like [Hermetia illucens]|uniref:uncharacterized protein DDB_G0284459-like n=1 Tax=Hermetia illucens TaxID=343691 RepID=UPI0018CC6B1D|nr:uncharacterized protein DDB_G0284459-like [Hermetia illucens]